MTKPSSQVLDSETLVDLYYGINGAGGGGNIEEFKKFGEVLGSTEIQIKKPDQFTPNATLCCLARLGGANAPANQYPDLGAAALADGVKELCESNKTPFPLGIFPVEAAGQISRAAWALHILRQNKVTSVSLADLDVTGGLAVPAVPLAFGIYESLAKYPDIALIELIPKDSKINPQITLKRYQDPEQLEDELRTRAGTTPLKAVWFAWFLSPAAEANELFTVNSVSNSITRGRIVRRALENENDPAEALLAAGEIREIAARATVVQVEEERVPGFSQYAYMLETTGETLKLAARNEYIVLYEPEGPILARAPDVISVINKNGPVQSPVLKVGDEISVVVATPQCLINKPSAESEWKKIWNKYWENEKRKGTWKHPY